MDTGKKRNSYEVVTADREAGIVAAWSRPRGDNGCFGTAVMVPWAPDGAAEDGEGCSYWTRSMKSGNSFDWYMGAVWSKASPVKSAEQWEKEVRRVRDCIRTPLRVKVR